jgi:acyl-CoA synthetase (AMP-forming)/AMP-acid ligase II
MAGEPLTEPGPGWPRMTLAAARAALTAPGARFEMEVLPIRGVPTRVWKNAPPSLPALVGAAFAGHAERLFVVHEDERVTYEAAGRAIAALAAHLLSLGIGRGDRVALAMRNLPEWPVAFFAITAIRAIAVPLNAWWTGAEMAFGLTDSGARLLIADGERHQRLWPHRDDLPALEQVLVARSMAPVGDRAERLEAIIGTPARWANLPQ